MGNKKRDSSALEEDPVVELAEEKKLSSGNESPGSGSSNKRLKKEKLNKKKKSDSLEVQNDDTVPSTTPKTHKTSVNSMETKKQRKSFDKERHLLEEKKDGLASKNLNLETKNLSDGNEVAVSSGGGLLPELHMGVFMDLASADASVREAAAIALVLKVREIQDLYERLENKDDVEDKSKLEADKKDGLDNCAPSLRYAIRRLIRGVSSSRESARQGFALGLAIVVEGVRCIKLKSLLKLIVDELEVPSSMKGQDAKDCLLGRLFAYGALARSGKLIDELKEDSKSPHIKELTSCLVVLADKRRYLREPASAIISEMVGKFPVEALLNHVLEAPGLQEWFDRACEVGNPDALYLALKIQEKVNVDNKFGKLLPSPYSKNSFFASDHLSGISMCLKESTFCLPRVHSVWPVIVNILLSDVDLDSASGLPSIKKHKRSRRGSSAEEDLKRNLCCFCEVIIEGSLLTSSHDRKKLALDVLLLLFPRLPSSCVHLLLSYKVVQCLVDILATKDSWLYKVAQHFLKELSECVNHDDAKRAEVILALQKNSNGKFDCITRSKMVKDMMTEFKTEHGCVLLIENLITVFLDEGHSSDEPSDQSQTTDDNSEISPIEEKDITEGGVSDFLKGWIVESFPFVLKHLKLEPDARFRVQKEVLKFLAVQGLYSSSLGTEVTSFELQEKLKWPKSAIPTTLCQMCIEQLQLLLANAQKGEGLDPVGSGVEANDLGSYFMRFLGIVCSIPSVSLSVTLNIDDEKAFKKLQDMVAQLSKQGRTCGDIAVVRKLHALRYLLIQLLLQILLRPGEFFEAASELVACCKEAFGIDTQESSSEDDQNPNDVPELMDVFVDTILSLLPQSSAPLRSAIEQVFRYFCGEITDDGLLRMLGVIKKDLKPARRVNPDEDDDSDEEVLGIEDAVESDEAETGEMAESDDDDDDDNDDDDSSEPVGGVGAFTELPEVGDDDSDGGMDDDAMFRMDIYLAKIFRERKNQARGETAHSQLVLFKLRVLSLLEIYLHENPGKTQVLKVFSNLAQAFVNPQTTEGSEQLGQRIWGIIQKKIFKAKDYPRGESVELSVLENLLEKYLKLAAKPFKRKKSASITPSKKKQSASWNRYRIVNSLARSSTFWILKIIDGRNFPESQLEKVCEIFNNILIGYFDSKKSQLKPEFVKEVFKRRPWIGRHLFGFLLQKCTSAKSQFRQVEALELVAEVLKSLVSTNDDGKEGKMSKNFLEGHVSSLCRLIEQMVTNMPEKQSRRTEVRKFCGKVFQILESSSLASIFLSSLGPDGQSACESQLGEVFISLMQRADLSNAAK